MVGIKAMWPVLRPCSSAGETRIGAAVSRLIISPMPRPETIRISVAMIGWMSSTATRNPFHKPHSRPTPSARRG